MIMITSFILIIAIINFILGFIALGRGKEKVNICFFILSSLLGAWNLTIALRVIYGFYIFDRLSYLFINFVPVIVFMFIAAILKAENKIFIKTNTFLSAAFCFFNFFIILFSFFYEALLALFYSYGFRLYFFIYVISFLLLAFFFILNERRKIKFKQERIKITYLVVAFLVMFIGGTLDFTGGLKLHNLWYSGNVANLIYAFIIFYSIFRLRLFNADFIFINFLVYTIIALILSVFYLAADYLFNSNKKLMFFFFSVFTIFIIYFSKYILKIGHLFFEKIGTKSQTQKINEEFEQIKLFTIDDEDIIKRLLELLKERMEMEIAVYLKSGNYFLRKWSTSNTLFKDYVETQEDLTGKLIIKYEVNEKKSKEVLDKFNCDVLILFSGIDGVLAGQKQIADISFLEDEINLIYKITETLSFYIRIYILRMKLIEKENEKRTDMMSHQIAHEIKNPLASLWGAAQLLVGKDEKEKENILIIQQEIQRLLKILDSWRQFSKELKLNKAELSLKQVINEVIKVIKLERKISIDFIFTDDINIKVDEERLKQVLFNILKNSIEATAAAIMPYIKIELKKKNKYAEIVIKDNGTGIKPDILAKLKTPFFTTKQQGSGLGLAVSNKIINAHGGVLLINSDGVSYTEVVISLPIGE